jgi:hypothetical protein
MNGGLDDTQQTKQVKQVQSIALERPPKSGLVPDHPELRILQIFFINK